MRINDVQATEIFIAYEKAGTPKNNARLRNVLQAYTHCENFLEVCASLLTDTSIRKVARSIVEEMAKTVFSQISKTNSEKEDVANNNNNPPTLLTIALQLEAALNQHNEQEIVRISAQLFATPLPNTIITDLARYTCSKTIHVLIENGCDANARDGDDNTPLHIACQYGQEDVVRVLVTRQDVDINAQNKYGNTPLHAAAAHENPALVHILLSRSDLIRTIPNNDGQTAENISKHTKNAHIQDRFAKIALGKRPTASPNNNNNAFAYTDPEPYELLKTAMHTSIATAQWEEHQRKKQKTLKEEKEQSQQEKEQKRLEQKLEECKNFIHKGDIAQFSRSLRAISLNPLALAVLLHTSIREKKSRFAALLLEEHGAFIHSRNKDGDSALDIAARTGQMEILTTLLQHQNIDVNISNDQGVTALHHAAKAGQVEAVRSLIQAGADVNAQDQKGKSVVDYVDATYRETKVTKATAFSNSGKQHALTAQYNARIITQLLVNAGVNKEFYTVRELLRETSRAAYLGA